MRKSIVTGIDVGTHTTRVVVCEVDDTGAAPRIIAQGESVSYGIRHGTIINKYDATKSVRKALAAAEQEAGVDEIREAFVALGGIGLNSHTISSSIELSAHTETVTEYDIDRAVAAAEESLLAKTKNIKIIRAEPLRYVLDGKRIFGRPIGMEGSRLMVTTLFVSYLEHHLEDLLDVIADAGVVPTDVVPAPVASALALMSPKQKMVGAAVVDVGAETVSIAAFEDGVLISVKVFSIGSADITNDIALGFQIPLDTAENAKRGVIDRHKHITMKHQLKQIVEARLHDIFELVQSHLDSIKKRGSFPGGLIVTGGGSKLVSLEDFTKENTKLPAIVAKIPENGRSRRQLKDTSWYTAYGLCYHALDQEFFSRSKTTGKSINRAKKGILEFFKQFIP
jgi:cell division protein FtsA